MQTTPLVFCTLLVALGLSHLASAFFANTGQNFQEDASAISADGQLLEWRDPDFAKPEEETDRGQRLERRLQVLRAVGLHPMLSTVHDLLASSKGEVRQKYRSLIPRLLSFGSKARRTHPAKLQQRRDGPDYEDLSTDVQGKVMQGKRGDISACSLLGLSPLIGLPVGECLTSSSVIRRPGIRSTSESASKFKTQGPSLYLLGGVIGR